jgi:hypothetical protein
MEDDVMVLLADDACDETAMMVELREKVAAQELVVEATLVRKERYLAGLKVTGLVGRGEGLVARGEDKKSRGEDKVTLKTGLVANNLDKVSLGTGLVARGEGLVANNLDKVSLRTGKVANKTDKRSCKTDKVSCKTDKKSLKTDKKSLAVAHLLTLKLDQMKDVKQKKVRGCMSDKALDIFLTLVCLCSGRVPGRCKAVHT